jgi:hypothetical protein
MPNFTQTIYSNGRFSVVPLVTLLCLEVEGRRLQTFAIEEIEQAVAEVDRMAESDGLFAQVSM